MSPYFTLIAITIFGALNLISYACLAPNTVLKRKKIVLRLFFILLFFLEALYFFNIKNELFSGVIFMASVSAIGASFMLFCVSLFYALFLGVARIMRLKRARFFIDCGVILAAFGYIFFGVYNALFATHISAYDLELKNLQKPLNIAIISDVHIGHFLKSDFLKRAVDNINALAPDAVFIVGDLVDLNAQNLAGSLDPLKEINAPIFMVLGNHEYYHGASGLIRAFEDLGIVVLKNQSVVFKGINIAGALDIQGLKMEFLQPDFDAIFNEIDPQKPLILLSHQPKSLLFLTPSQLAKTDLLISGHTHNGQIFPFNLLVKLDQKYTHGLYELDSVATRLIVSSGLGFWGPPMRIGSQSEIVLLRLKAAK